jgi:hypothetical protein
MAHSYDPTCICADCTDHEQILTRRARQSERDVDQAQDNRGPSDDRLRLQLVLHHWAHVGR